MKEVAIQTNGLTFTIKFMIASRISTLWKKYYLQKDTVTLYDPRIALDKADEKEPYGDPEAGEIVSFPLKYHIPKDTPVLSPEEIVSRTEEFIILANKCVEEESIRKIMKSVVRKKNGTLYKGRVLHLGYLNCVDTDGATSELAAVNKSDSQMIIEIRHNTPVTESFINRPFLFLEDSDRQRQIQYKKETYANIEKNKKENAYSVYRRQMAEALTHSYEEYVSERNITSAKLLNSIATDIPITFESKTFVLGDCFECREKVCEEIEKRGGKARSYISHITDYYVVDLRNYDPLASSFARRKQKESYPLKIITDYQLWKALFESE